VSNSPEVDKRPESSGARQPRNDCFSSNAVQTSAEVCGEAFMFESVKEDDRKSGMVYVLSLLISLAVHAVIVSLLVLLPLFFFNVLQAGDLVTFVIGPPVPPPAPPAPTPPPVAGSRAARSVILNTEIAPGEIPKGIPVPDPADLDPVDPGLFITAMPGAPGSGTPERAWVGNLIVSEPVILPPPERPKPKPKPIRVGTIELSKLILKVPPTYPPLAVKTHVMGTVVLEALIDEDGSVSTVRILSGHPLLVDAAVEAVKQWKYSPTILNGEPVPVIATVTVVFRLN
jgi:periplasmic protein TonB